MACPCEARGISTEETTATKNVELAIVLVMAAAALAWFFHGEKKRSR